MICASIGHVRTGLPYVLAKPGTVGIAHFVQLWSCDGQRELFTNCKPKQIRSAAGSFQLRALCDCLHVVYVRRYAQPF